MTKQQALTVLKAHQDWRRYDGPIYDAPAMQSPKRIGKAIDVAIDALGDIDSELVKFGNYLLSEKREQRTLEPNRRVVTDGDLVNYKI